MNGKKIQWKDIFFIWQSFEQIVSIQNLFLRNKIVTIYEVLLSLTIEQPSIALFVI